MSVPVYLPFWLAGLLWVLASGFVLDRLLIPGARWVLRRRLDRAIDRLNKRLHIHVRPFKLTRREVLVDRLTFDPKVVEEAEAVMAATGEPRATVMRRVVTYAREIVPSFRPGAYFRAGYALGRAVARSLYRVRVGYVDDAGLSTVDPASSVVFVMNHRSNMDYILVGYLAADRTALSYAVGEWARIWPLQTLIRAMGAYFIRRRSGDPLYRRVLERYVQMATESGVVQAVFPEGGLTRDGSLRPPKLGLLDYMLRAFDPRGARDLVFVPVAINYDRVFEDRTLLRDAQGSDGSGLVRASLVASRFVVRNLALMALRRWHRFGYACVNFGSPVSTRAWVASHGVDFRDLGDAGRPEAVATFAGHLMERVGAIVPVLPVSLVSTALLDAGDRAVEGLELHERVQALVRRLGAAGAHVYVPRDDEEYAVAVGLRMLVLRRLVEERDGAFRAVEAEKPILRYYANAIAHLFAAGGGPAGPERE